MTKAVTHFFLHCDLESLSDGVCQEQKRQGSEGTNKP